MSNNKIASYMNLKGTTLPSFKMGKNGVELRSFALMNKEKSELTGLFYKTSVEDESTKFEREEFEKNGIEYPEYDVAIPSRNIRRLYASKTEDNIDTLTVILTDGRKFVLSQKITAESLILPTNAEDGEFAMYSKDSDGSIGLKKSNMKLTEEIKDTVEDDEENKIPTVAAVRNHINGVSQVLNVRLNGDNVTKD